MKQCMTSDPCPIKLQHIHAVVLEMGFRPRAPPRFVTLGLQIAQSRYYLKTLDPKVGTICVLGALGLGLIGSLALFDFGWNFGSLGN